ncbi:MAG: D-alanyl-D-alanine carboxypeptidase [Leptospiraceae bacterium]|nr:D-alanyl-D-alanine carboxypeptidase [Leptospiraceae bacterium]MBK7057108.1 D-alanyl-D-alanine carboxypeptidase [Leptospiraceae bacterium]MBK9502505.1 D-alanyl-D-alanine carboxypeptidase [Leptospiraceae bacterium]
MKYLIFLMILLISNNSYADKKLELSAKSYLLQDINSTKLLYQKDIGIILPIASITKLVTALISSSERKMTDYVKISKSTVLRNEGDKSAVLKEGEFYTEKDLLLTMLVSSTNVSAISLATDVSGSPENFILKMNQWAKEKKLTKTSFGDTFGLSPLSKSSVEDISKILDMVEQNTVLLEILSTTSYSIQERSGRLQNLTTTNEMPSYKDFRIFGKTGTTKLAGKCFAGFAVRRNEKWKIILLGSNNVFDDMKKMLDSIN